ncbi:MAG TPA: hypothetical protein VEJ84_00805 [Acidimicrobiales bacterium]|nr:hypothetical protein [Acidimicrobiales bacterium]
MTPGAVAAPGRRVLHWLAEATRDATPTTSVPPLAGQVWDAPFGAALEPEVGEPLMNRLEAEPDRLRSRGAPPGCRSREQRVLAGVTLSTATLGGSATMVVPLHY